jgi:hypothetical protein
MRRYCHRQLGTLVLWIGGLSVLMIILLLLFAGVHPIGITVLLCLVICIVLFSTLTVEVTDTDIHLRFGPGLIRKRIPLSSIRSARAVRNAWYFGWGIRALDRGWLYNVSGLDAIELVMTDGRICRIGTDQPAEFLAAIKAACGMTG